MVRRDACQFRLGRTRGCFCHCGPAYASGSDGMIVLSEDSPRLTPSASARSLKAVTEAAKIAGCHTHYIPQEEMGISAAEALSYVPIPDKETPGVWLGYIPSPEWYGAIYEAAFSKSIRLLNTLEEHLNAQEFDRTYVRLQELTPASIILSDSS